MAQIPVNKDYMTFVRGLITEAGPFTFPENSSQDESNFKLNLKGYRQRRLGIDYEANIDHSSEDLESTGTTLAYLEDAAISLFKWEGVNNDGNIIIICVQIGNSLKFFDATAAPVTSALLGEISFSLDESDKTSVFQYSSVSGRLIIVTGGRSIFQIVYNTDVSGNFEIHEHGLLVRDLWGVEDSYADEFRVLESETVQPKFDTRWYNLINRGWGSTNSIGSKPSIILFSNFAKQFRDDIDRWPNLQDVLSAGILPDEPGNVDTDVVVSSSIGGASSPVGFSVIDIFQRGITRYYLSGKLSIMNNYSSSSDTSWGELSGASGRYLYGCYDKIKTNGSPSALGAPLPSLLVLPTDRTEGGIKCVAPYAGRLFYSGFSSTIVDGDPKSPNLGSYVAFSQVAESIDSVGKCFQAGDPTSYDNSDLVASDGGTIKIPEAAQIIKLFSFGQILLVFATNGVWEIRGGVEDGFSATSYQVNKVTNVGLTSPESVIEAEGGVYYWSDSGIYTLQADPGGFSFRVDNVTSTTIQSYYNDIPSTAKRIVTAAYSGESKVISWMFSNDALFGTLEGSNYRLNSQLNLDLRLQAFYHYTFSSDLSDVTYPAVAGLFISPNVAISTYVDQVVVNGDQVQADGVDVVITSTIPINNVSNLTYLILTILSSTDPYITFGQLNNPSFLDWETYDSTGVDAPAYLETGFETLGDSQRNKQGHYVSVHMERTETGFDVNLDPLNPSGCLMTTKWDFANHANSGKIADPVQVYRLRRNYIPANSADTFDYGQSVITSKNKIRGRGKSLVLRFESEPAKDCVIYGWGTTFKVNADD
jgi:hypothetical protein